MVLVGNPKPSNRDLVCVSAGGDNVDNLSDRGHLYSLHSGSCEFVRVVLCSHCMVSAKIKISL